MPLFSTDLQVKGMQKLSRFGCAHSDILMNTMCCRRLLVTNPPPQRIFNFVVVHIVLRTLQLLLMQLRLLCVCYVGIACLNAIQ